MAVASFILGLGVVLNLGFAHASVAGSDPACPNLLEANASGLHTSCRINLPDGMMPLAQLGPGQDVLSFDPVKGQVVANRVASVERLGQIDIVRVGYRNLYLNANQRLFFLDRKDFFTPQETGFSSSLATLSSDGTRLCAGARGHLALCSAGAVLNVRLAHAPFNFFVERVLVQSGIPLDVTCDPASTIKDL